MYSVQKFIFLLFNTFKIFRGHGTYLENEDQIAAVAGVVSRVSRLITVTPLRQVYQGY